MVGAKQKASPAKRTVPRPFTMPWGRGEIVEEATTVDRWHEPDAIWQRIPARARAVIQERGLRLCALDTVRIARETATEPDVVQRMQGIVLVGAAGNNNREETFYPASMANVVSVSAIASDDGTLTYPTVWDAVSYRLWPIDAAAKAASAIGGVVMDAIPK